MTDTTAVRAARDALDAAILRLRAEQTPEAEAAYQQAAAALVTELQRLDVAECMALQAGCPRCAQCGTATRELYAWDLGPICAVCAHRQAERDEPGHGLAPSTYGFPPGEE